LQLVAGQRRSILISAHGCGLLDATDIWSGGALQLAASAGSRLDVVVGFDSITAAATTATASPTAAKP
jgi:hypothetical protein